MTTRVGGRQLARNAALNAVGQVLPLLVALPVLPYVLDALGAERFAVLTLAWTVIGYFGFLDLGLGRAATQLVARLLGEGREAEVGRVVWSSLASQAALGVAGGILIAALAPTIAERILRITDPLLLSETTAALAVVALALPLVLLSGTLSGVLEAHQRFDLVNGVRVPANAATLAVPALGVMLGATLPVIVAGIVVARVAALVAFAFLATRAAGRMSPVRPDPTVLRRLLSFGGWLTVTLLAVPVLTYAERLLIGGMRSLAELAYYAVPFEIVARTAVIPSAVAMTLFPAFSHAHSDGARVDDLFRRPLRVLFLFQWPLLVTLWLFGGEILQAWVGPEAAAHGTAVLRLLAIAFFLNAFSQVPLAGVHGLGRPDLKAKLDLFEVPAFVLLAVLLIPRYGIAGAAAAKLLITVVDTVALFAFARRLGSGSLRMQPALAAAMLGLAAAAAFAVALPVAERAAVLAVTIAAPALLVWFRVLDGTDRAAVRGVFVRLRPAREIAS